MEHGTADTRSAGCTDTISSNTDAEALRSNHAHIAERAKDSANILLVYPKMKGGAIIIMIADTLPRQGTILEGLQMF